MSKRRLIHDDEQRQLVVEIDEEELRLEQFGKLQTTYAGWSKGIEFVPKSEVHRGPVHEVRNPELETEEGNERKLDVIDQLLLVRQSGEGKKSDRFIAFPLS